MNQQKLQTYIEQISLLSAENLALMLSCAHGLKLKRGEPVLREGEVCRSFYLVDKGYLRTWYNKNGVPINLHFTFEGSFVSNIKSFKSRRPSEFTIEAGEGAVVWVFDIDKISPQHRQRPQIAIFIRRLAIRLLLASEEHSNMFKLYTPTERYRYIEQHKPGLLQRISLSQLSSYLGVTRETLSRIRAKSR